MLCTSLQEAVGGANKPPPAETASAMATASSLSDAGVHSPCGFSALISEEQDKVWTEIFVAQPDGVEAATILAHKQAMVLHGALASGLPRLLASGAQPSDEAIAQLTRQVHGSAASDVALVLWAGSARALVAAVASAAAASPRPSPLSTKRAMQATAQTLLAVSKLACTPSYLERVTVALIAGRTHSDPVKVERALLAAHSVFASACTDARLSRLPGILSHDAYGACLAKALFAAVRSLSSCTAPGWSARASTLAARLCAGGWATHLATACLEAWNSQSKCDPGYLQPHTEACRVLWSGVSRSAMRQALWHALPQPPDSNQMGVKSLPLFGILGDPHEWLLSGTLSAAELCRGVPLSGRCTPYCARHWYLYMRAAVSSGEQTWESVFHILHVAQAWSQPLAVAGADTRAQKATTDVLALLLRNAPHAQVALGSRVGQVVMQGVQERLNSPNPSVKVMGMLVGSILSHAAAASAFETTGVELPVLDWASLLTPDFGSKADKSQVKAASDQAVADLMAFLLVPNDVDVPKHLSAVRRGPSVGILPSLKAGAESQETAMVHPGRFASTQVVEFDSKEPPPIPTEFADDTPRDEAKVLVGRAIDSTGQMDQPTSLDDFAAGMLAASGVHDASTHRRDDTSVPAAAAGVPTIPGFEVAQGSIAPAGKYGQLPAPPVHLREVLATLRKPLDYKHLISALASVGPLVSLLSKSPDTAHEVHDSAVALLRVLLGTENSFGLEEFAAWKHAGVVAVIVASPVISARFLTKVVFAQEQLLGMRLEVLTLLTEAAIILAGVADPEQAGGSQASTPQRPAEGSDAQVNTLIQELVQHASSEPHTAVAKQPKTRRWGKSKARATTKVNVFATVVGEFVFPLVVRVLDPTSGVDLLGRDAELLSALLRSLAIMVEVAASAPNISAVVGAVLPLALAAHLHDDPSVRHAVLCVLVAAAGVVHSLGLHQHTLVHARPSFTPSTAGLGVGHDADLLRSALQARAGSEDGESVAHPAGASISVLARQAHGRSPAPAETFGEALGILARWAYAVMQFDPDAQCRDFARRVVAQPAVGTAQKAASPLEDIMSMMGI